MITPYFDDGQVALYLGDMREILPALGVTADLVVADPPYGETSLGWDRWPDRWLDAAAAVTASMWCFGSMRMFGERWHEYGDAGWKLSQDVIGADEDGEPIFSAVHVVWEKHNGSGFATDRFRRVHEHVLHWYRGPWKAIRHEVPRVPATSNRHAKVGDKTRQDSPAHTGVIGVNEYIEIGTRLARSVLKVRSMNGFAIHPNEKPVDLLCPLITYACPPAGLVVDVFAGSGSTLEAARLTGRRAIGIEGWEPYAEKAARRLSRATLEVS